MSKAYEGQDPAAIAAEAEKDLNSLRAKTGHEETSKGASTSSAFICLFSITCNMNVSSMRFLSSYPR